MRIGVFVCHCGSNIAGTVDCPRVVEAAKGFPHVLYATDYTYLCAESGQDLIKTAVQEYSLDRVVVSSCSPKMHEETFRRAARQAGLNPYLVEMANIREQCSWIHSDKEAATRKAIDLVRKAVFKVSRDQELFPSFFKVNKDILVIGGGIAGIQAALDAAQGGHRVTLVEKDQTIGGNMARLDKTFPTLDCSSCILTPRMVDVAVNENIELLAYHEVEEVKGYVGNFDVKIRRKATYVDWSKCTGCEECVGKCPARIYDKFNQGLGRTKAISLPFPQAVPKKVTIKKDFCHFFLKGKCRVCEKVCQFEAINFDDQDQIIERKVGAIVVATGYEAFDPIAYLEYGFGKYKDVITSLQYERMVSASGPTMGHIKRPSDGEEPKTIVFISCVGSRDRAKGRSYCSVACCMAMAKQAILTKEHIPDSTSYLFYIDIRAGGKGYEEFVDRAREEYGAQYVRGRVSKIYQKGKKLVVKGTDTLLGMPIEIEADLVVLAVGIAPPQDAPELAQKLNISYDQYGFFVESHPKLRPVETNTTGVFLAGACQVPMDIPASVAQGSAAAAKALGLLAKDELEASPIVASVEIKRCVGCFKCEAVCPFSAIQRQELRDGIMVSNVISTVCKGCGLCGVACPTGAIKINGFTDEQILAEMEALLL
ncbi:heterodisulfide reductase subunit A2 [Candidatus Hakubella thermalkaliphila]|uniref:Heterodisulfide reductase subunit A2 n=1 Tax=Candidatus Hakubella thermalkaliphila TaxID=2754717 RepID=A0A6V8NLT4_9ACTN|nr:heterodisulfide reductase subunit A2 [Candidatus Hakubella thermalkaliphila]